ncbi:MAG: ABC transporter substrate-binding protein [Comamonadaceae bacterium]|nr:MAG: ABC transporter substrate-binding protein [Comamonadaceae bacterium]
MWRMLVAVCCAVTLASCDRAPLPAADSEVRQKITVALTGQPQSTLVHVALSKGYFLNEGLDVQPLMHTFGKEALQSVLDGKADFATVAETPVMFSVLKGDRIFVIANIESSSVNDAVLARRDAGIARPGDVKGKRVGFTPGTTSDFFLDSFLTAQGLTRQQIAPVPLKPDEMQDALLTKKVDAVATWNYPLTQIRRQLGAQAVIFYDRQIYTETFNIAAMQDFVRQNPQTLKRFLRALIQAEDFVARQPEQAQDIVTAAIKVDKELVKEVWDAFSYQVRLDQNLLITLEDETRWAMKNKLTDKTVMPNYAEYIHVDSLRAVKPEAVKLKR